MQRTYKATGIVYDTDGVAVTNLPDALTVTAENEDGVADAISDRIGWCVKAIKAIELVIPTSQELFEEYNRVHAKAENAVNDLLDKRGVTSINVKAYTDNNIFDTCYFNLTDKHGCGVRVSIDTIHKDEKRGWVADCIDEDWNVWGTLDLDSHEFDAEDLLFILKTVEDIFQHADENNHGKVLAAGENYDDVFPMKDDVFPMKLVYITPEQDHRPSQTVTLNDNGGQGYDHKTAGGKLLALLEEINTTRYADWDEARKHTASKEYLAKVLPDSQLHPLLQVPAVNYFGIVTYTLVPLSEDTEDLEIETFLRDHQADISEVNESPEGTVIVSVEWGDWKHSHAYLDNLMGRLGYVKDNETVTEEDGSDCYSADHYFSKTK